MSIKLHLIVAMVFEIGHYVYYNIIYNKRQLLERRNKGERMVKRELKGLLLNPVMILVVVVIVLIPSIYTIPFLSSMWDPYGRMSELPVAVVNEDVPVMYQNKMLTVGDDLVDNLKDNDSLDFHFVDAKTAEEGLQDTTYYMTITIPVDFSANASTVMDQEPKPMRLQYKTNPGTNYIASKLCTTAVEKIRTSVSEEVSKTYTEAVFDGFDEIASGMDDAADGAGQMLSGEKELIAGNRKIGDGLGTLATGGDALYNGAKKLEKGVSAYTAGVESVDGGIDKMGKGVITFKQQTSAGTAKLTKGSSDLKTGVQSYTSGVASIKAGAGKLMANSDTLNTGMASLSAAAAKVKQGSGTLYGGLQALQKETAATYKTASEEKAPALKKSMEEFSKTLNSLNSMVQNYQPAALPDTSSQLTAAKTALNQLKGTEMTEQQQELVTQLEHEIGELESNLSGAATGGQSLTQIKQLSAGLAQSYPKMETNINSGVNQLIGGYDTISQNLTLKIIPGANNLDTGIGQMQSEIDEKLVPGVNSYTSGVAGISSGLTTLNETSSQLNSGAGNLETGIRTFSTGISSGTQTLQKGISKLEEGTEQLTGNSEKLNTGSAALSSGAQQIQSGARQLEQGSGDLGSGLEALQSGTAELKDGIQDGAEEVKENKADDASLEMMSSPVNLDGVEEHPVPDNGHAMAAYMMSVALWVGALAFCLMYPLTKYRGTLHSGFNWWLSKAVVLYPIAIGMALSMLLLLHKFCGFNPADWKNTIMLACLAALAFMSLMYFFNALMGRVGSFIMLVFMIIQLAGSAGTYPIELSGDFVADINPFLPFSYTVTGFRSTISGCETNLMPCCVMLLLILMIFTGLSIWLFMARSRKIKAGKHTFHDFIDSRGLG